MAMVEKTKIWIDIKAALPFINACDINSVELLLWSQDKGLKEVRERLASIKRLAEEDVAKNAVKIEQKEMSENEEDSQEEICLDS